VARTLAVRSIEHLEAFAAAHPQHLHTLEALALLTFALTTMTLEELASEEMPRLVGERLH
jgi:hypothetical protein